MNWQRARTEEKRSERKDAICSAAFNLFKQHGYENVSFNGIAAEAGFTKSNMYRYFSSREEIFLNIFSSLFEKWADDYCKQIKKLEQEVCVERFAKVWVKSFKHRPQFLDLTPILFISLEKNSSFDQLVKFKRLAKERLYEIAIEISRIYPELDIENSFRFLNFGYAATSNFWAAATENEVLKKVYRSNELKPLKTNFEIDLTAALEVAIYGLKERSKEANKHEKKP